MKTKHIIIIILLIFAVETTYGQKLSFTKESEYINEMTTMLLNSKRPELDTVFNNFRQLWNSGKLQSDEKSSIVKLSNIFYKKRMKAYPHFYQYMKFILSFKNKRGANPMNFRHSQLFLMDYAKNKRISSTQVNTLLEKLFFLNKYNYIYKSPAVTWKTNGKYTIDNDEKNISVKFDKTDLICRAHKDSFTIHNTKGSVNLLEGLWQGNEGKVTWEYAGLHKDSVFATISNYKIQLKKKGFVVENSKFINKRLMSKELAGIFEMKLLANRRGAKASYPKFSSKEKLHIKDIMPGIKYVGSISMSGNKIAGSKIDKSKSQIFITHENQELVEAKADRFAFNFNSKQIDARNVSVKIKLNNDSITHSCINLMYKQKETTLILSRPNSNFPEKSFIDSYHKAEIDADFFKFNLKDSVLVFSAMPTTHRNAIISSANYFSKSHFNNLRMLDRKNPISIVRNLVSEEENTIHLSAFSRITRMSKKNCIDIANRLAVDGFVDYDKTSEILTAKPKLFFYVLANSNKIDYDKIKMVSKDTKINAIFNLKNNELIVHGVSPFVLSYNRRVGVFPKDNKVVLKKDFNMEFDGRVNAGLIDILGENFKFDYNKFVVDIPENGTLSMKYLSRTDSNTIEAAPVKSVIEKISGSLFIDDENNKSGKEKTLYYPMFESKKTAKVFYEQVIKKDSLNSDTLYKADNFYFETLPFVMDSLNSLTRDNIKFKGSLTSASIFPEIKECLKIQEDEALGFIHKVPEGKGIDIYKGQGTYHNTIILNNSGLKGEGKLEHLNSAMSSNEFRFYTDSTNAYANNLKMQKQSAPKTQYPDVETDSIYTHWEPKNKKMILTSLGEPHKMYEDSVSFAGTFQLEPTQLLGNGKLQISYAELNSNKFHFLDNSFNADTSDFILRKENEAKPPMVAQNVQAHVDLTKNEGLFKSNGENSYIDFKINQFLCYINYFVWDISKKKIQIGNSNDISIATSETDKKKGYKCQRHHLYQ